MQVAIMQPYFLPYIGYFQLINAVDLFIVYDNIEYTKKGWITRNRILQNGKDALFSLPLRRDSDYLNVRDRQLAADFDRDKLLRKIKGAYRSAPYLAPTIAVIEQIINNKEVNLFHFLRDSIEKVCQRLEITTMIRTSSDLPIDQSLKNQDKVLALCDAAGATTYVNAIGGVNLYSADAFQARNIHLKFLRSKPLEYPQFDNAFVPWLSIIDVMMFNSPERIREVICSGYDLV